jgi:hypothetical protein
MRSRPGFPTRQASAPICMAALIANVIKASSPWAAHKGRTYGRTAPVWGQQRKRVPLTAGSFHIWESQESVSRRVGISRLQRGISRWRLSRLPCRRREQCRIGRLRVGMRRQHHNAGGKHERCPSRWLRSVPRARAMIDRHPGREPDSFRLTDASGKIFGVFPIDQR